MSNKNSSRGARIIACACVLSALLCVGSLATPTQAQRGGNDEAGARAAVERVFGFIKNGSYDDLYNLLPSSSRAKISKAQFTRGLAQARDAYALDRFEINSLRVSGDLAVVETTMYGRVFRPVKGDGKIVSQQYLIRENGTWRVAVDRASAAPFLKDNAEFARQNPARQPHIYFKDEKGRWIDVSTLQRGGRTN